MSSTKIGVLAPCDPFGAHDPGMAERDVSGILSLVGSVNPPLSGRVQLWYTGPWKQPMSFKTRHKKIYVAWVVISALVALSMVLFLVAPFFLY